MYGKSLDAEATSMSTHLEEFVTVQNQLIAKLRVNAEQFQAAETEVKSPNDSRAIDINVSIDPHGTVECNRWSAPQARRAFESYAVRGSCFRRRD